MSNLRNIKDLLNNCISAEAAVKLHFWSAETYESFFSSQAPQLGKINPPQQGFPILSLSLNNYSADAAEAKICSVYEDYYQRGFWGKLYWRLFEHWDESIEDYERFYTLIRLRKLKEAFDPITNKPLSTIQTYSLFLAVLSAVYEYFSFCFPSAGFFDWIFQDNNMITNLKELFDDKIEIEYQKLNEFLDQILRQCSFDFVYAMKNPQANDIHELIGSTKQWLKDAQNSLNSNLTKYPSKFKPLENKFSGVNFILSGLINDLSEANQEKEEIKPIKKINPVSQLPELAKAIVDNKFNALTLRIKRLEQDCDVRIISHQEWGKTKTEKFTYFVKLDKQNIPIEVHYVGKDIGTALKIKIGRDIELQNTACTTFDAKKQIEQSLFDFHAKQEKLKYTRNPIEKLIELPQILSSDKEEPIHAYSLLLAEEYSKNPNAIFPGPIGTLLIQFNDYAQKQSKDFMLYYNELYQRFELQAECYKKTIQFIDSKQESILNSNATSQTAINNLLTKDCVDYKALNILAKRQARAYCELKIAEWEKAKGHQPSEDSWLSFFGSFWSAKQEPICTPAAPPMMTSKTLTNPPVVKPQFFAGKGKNIPYSMPKEETQESWDAWLLNAMKHPEMLEQAFFAMTAHITQITKEPAVDLMRFTTLVQLATRWIEAIKWKPMHSKWNHENLKITPEKAAAEAIKALTPLWRRSFALYYHPDKNKEEDFETIKSINNGMDKARKSIDDAVQSIKCPEWLEGNSSDAKLTQMVLEKTEELLREARACEEAFKKTQKKIEKLNDQFEAMKEKDSIQRKLIKEEYNKQLEEFGKELRMSCQPTKKDDQPIIEIHPNERNEIDLKEETREEHENEIVQEQPYGQESQTANCTL